MSKEKQSQAQDSIYMVRQFAYVHRVAGILRDPGSRSISSN